MIDTSYDARGRFEKITDAITGQLQYQYYYDAASNLTKRYNWITGVTQQFIYNPLDWITERDLFKGASTLASEIYGRNALGQVTLIDRIGTNDDRFGYYLDGELNWASYDSTLFKDATYTLDKAGNRTQVYDGTTWKTYSPNSINQYTVADAVTVTNNAEHQIGAFDGVTYTYYNDGRLASVSNGTTWTNFAYDAFGRLVRRIKDGWDAKYSYYDGEKELLECGVGGGAAFKNTYGKGIDEILKRLDTTNNWPLYFQQDANNNVTELTWSDGGVVEIFQYDAFGALNKAASGWGNPFLFTGRRYQSTFGIYEYRARAYSPRLGRFTGEDPKLYDAGDYNLFRYCHNDPLDLTDPMGLDPYAGAQATWASVSRDRAQEMTIGERISSWQKSMETGIAGERAWQALASTTTAGLHTSTMNYTGAAGLQNDAVRKIVGSGELAIDNDAGPKNGDPTYRSATSGRLDASGNIVSPEKGGRMIDSSNVPYAVAPKNLAAVNGGPLRAGDLAVVVNLRNNRILETQLGDFGPKGKFGEVSAAAVRPLGAETIYARGVGLVPTMDGRAASPIPVQVTFYPGSGE